MSAQQTCYLGLGSNIGDRRENLQRALDSLATHDVQVLRSSSLYDTDPVGEVPDQPTFLNACVRVATALEPEPLRAACKALERELGRDHAVGRHLPRTIDIDILLLGDREHRSERLQIPHEQLLSRRFVLVPLLELDFELVTPAGESLAEALLKLPLSEGVRLAGPPLRVGG